MRIRSLPFPAKASLPLWQWESDRALKAHPGYGLAKAGDQEAALSLIWDQALDFIRSLQPRLNPGLTYLAPYAREATGDNAIPLVMAVACAELLGGEVETEIVQSSRVFHTGAKPMERLWSGYCCALSSMVQ